MTKKFPTAIRWFRSDNRKSKIQNRKLAGAVAIAFAICGAVAEAQQPKNVPRLGYLSASHCSSRRLNADALRQGLRDLGYVEGQNIAIEYRWTEGNLDRLPALAAELVRLKVDIIFAAGGTAGRAAKKATSAIPIIFVGAVDPVATGMVASLAAAWRQHHRVQYRRTGVVRKTVGNYQGDTSQALPCGRPVESELIQTQMWR